MMIIKRVKPNNLPRLGFVCAAWVSFSFWGMPIALAQGSDTPALTISTSASSATAAELLAGDATHWDTPRSPIHLNLTPPLFQTDVLDDGVRPSTYVQIQKLDTLLYVKLTWNDRTADSVQATRAYADAGEPHIYKQQSEIVNQFPDAACVMVPYSPPGGGEYPGLMMGEETDSVRLYYWRAGEGFSVLRAAGRETATKTGEILRGRSDRARNEWSVVFAIPAFGDLTPLAFGIWDGARDHRDGIKYYSLWYDVR